MPIITFLFTDIEGSTALLQRVGEGDYAQILADHHGLIRSALAAHGGQEVDTQGDAFFAVFASPRDCVAAVVQMQNDLQGHSWPDGEVVRVRMGVHTGEASQTSAGLVGLDVHRAARIAAVAYGGQVVVSHTAAALLRDGLPAGAVLTDLGEHRLKDLGRPERIFQLHASGLPAEFPPLRSLGNPALLNNLPAQPTAFIGRAAELAEVRTLMASSRLVTLAGAGGAGKTRLALQVAADQLDGSGDGVWLAELAAVTREDAVGAAVCDALRIPAQPGRPAVDVLADALAPQHALIVLDNCEHLIGGCAKMADTVLRRCPRVHLLATSREPLGIDGETIYRVPTMSLPNNDIEPAKAETSDAVALFAVRARAQGVALTIDEETGPLVVSVCRRLDGLPLAIELAAARLRSMSLGALHDRLHDRFRLLTGGSRTAVERQQTLLATVGWSYSLLTAAEQTLLQRLSVFADGFDLDGAEAVCGFGAIGAGDVASLLGSLVDKSLVLAQHLGRGLRFRLLETIRQYAAEQLVDAGVEDETTAAHCVHFLDVVEVAAQQLEGKDQAQALGRLNSDQANIWRALEHAASDADRTELALRFAVALERYWPAQHELAESTSRLLAPVLERGNQEAEPRLYAAALIASAGFAVEIDAATALRLAGEAVGLARRLGDSRLLVKALGCLGGTYAWTSEPERGQPYALEAVELARQLGDDVLILHSLISYSLIWGLTADEARPLYSEAIARSVRSGDSMSTLELHAHAAVDELVRGNILAARGHAEEAVLLMRQIREDAAVMNLLGLVLRADRDPAARPTLEAALQVARRHGDYYAIAMSFLGLACLAADLGDWQRAAAMHGVAQAARNRTSSPWGLLGAPLLQESVAATRSAIGDEEFERGYARGLSLGVREAFELALHP